MQPIKLDDPIQIHGDPYDDWKFYRRQTNGMIEAYRMKRNGGKDFKLFDASKVTLKSTVQN
jgi:hypothetical protein